MTFQFRIDPDALKAPQMPYFEDATADNSQFHRARRTVEEAQQEVRNAIARLGGAIVQFIPVIFEQPTRYGYMIEYVFRGGAFGQYPVAALPIKSETAHRKDRARVQALLVAAHMLDAAANAQQHMPLSNPLMLHLLADGKQTIAQMIAERQSLPGTFLLETSK